MNKILKYLLAFALGPVAAAFFVVALRMLVYEVPWEALQWAAIGFVGYVLIYPLIDSPYIRFLEFFEHETNHMVTHMSMLRGMTHFWVDREKGGEVESNGKLALGCLMTLSPYYLPIVTVLLLPARILLPPNFIPFVDLAIGATLGFHYIGLFREFRFDQPDLRKQTVPFSIVVTLFANSVILMFIVGVLIQDYEIFLVFWQTALTQAGTYYTEIFDWLRTQDFAAML